MSWLIRHCYDDKRVAVVCDTGPGKTKQAHKDECDINRILQNYARTGLLNHVSQRPAFYVDVADLPDYRTALNNVKSAEELFNWLPAKTRARFDNEPAVFLDFCADPANEAELKELGLLPPDTIPGLEEAPEGATPSPGGQASEASAAEGEAPDQ